IRVGLLGAGGIATAHAMSLAKIPGVELCGIADIEHGRARRLAERWGTDAYGSLDELLGARPDAIHVLLPPDLHAKLAIACIEGGAHVFVEKPLCISEAECREVQAAAEKHGKLVAVNHNVTFEPAYLRLIEAVRQRKLGAIQHVAVFWSVPFGENAYGGPLYKKLGIGAAILETAPHPFSLITRLVGGAKSASVTMTTETAGAGGMPDTWSIGLSCERGTAQCFMGIARASTDTRVHVIGEDGAATVDLKLGTLSLVENTRFTPLFAKLADTLAQARDLAGDAVRNFGERLERLPSGGACDDGVPVFRNSI